MAGMETLPSAAPQAPRDGSLFMRPFALGATTYLLTINLLYLVTNGRFQSADRFSDLYFLVLGAYAGAPEIRRWRTGQDPSNPSAWEERIRKGGPIITLWVLLYALAVTWRFVDPARLMPPELKPITMEVIGLFLGTYALRQLRQKASAAKGAAKEAADPPLRAQILSQVTAQGPSTPNALSAALGIPRRTLGRLLKEMVQDGSLVRQARYANDPSALYQVKNKSES